jgi:hypothetical protein
MVMFKTKNKFNIDERFANLTTFSYEKKVKTNASLVETHTYECSIRGVRVQGSGEGTSSARANSRYTWVKIEGAEYQVPPAMIKKWLLQYGDLMTDLSEELEELEVSSDEEIELFKGIEMPTGVYSVQMMIKKPIPQFLPMDGKRIKIYHRDIKRMCQNCFSGGHYRAAYPREKVDWMAYVDYFIMESGFEEEMFGKWVSRVNDWQILNGQAHQENMNFLNRKKAAENARKENLVESRASIAKTLADQSMLVKETTSEAAAEAIRTNETGAADAAKDEKKYEQTANPQTEEEGMKDGEEEVEKMSKGIGELSVEELERELAIRKKGRPSNAGKKEKAAMKKELDKKKAREKEDTQK